MAGVDVLALKRATVAWASSVLDEATRAMPDRMRGYAPIGKPTARDDGYTPGGLRESIQVAPSSQRLGLVDPVLLSRIVAPVIQAKTTDQGSPSHIIRSRKSHGLLVFEIGGQTVVTSKSVNHPGNTARPWWQRALNATWGPNLRFAAIRIPFGSR